MNKGSLVYVYECNVNNAILFQITLEALWLTKALLLLVISTKTKENNMYISTILIPPTPLIFHHNILEKMETMIKSEDDADTQIGTAAIDFACEKKCYCSCKRHRHTTSVLYRQEDIRNLHNSRQQNGADHEMSQTCFSTRWKM